MKNLVHLTKRKIPQTVAFIFLSVLAGYLIAMTAPAANGANRATTPLTYANAVSFFKGTKLRATEVQPRCAIFFDGKWTSANVYDYCVIMVENSDEDVQVTFYLTDAHQMNWVTEFLDSPFFSRNETDKLFRLMNARSDVRGQNMGRFRVDFHHWQPRHADILVFSFTPIRQQTGPLLNLLRESLTIAGWVAMWRPMQIFLYDWWPLREIGRVYKKLSRMRVEVRSGDATG